ncbi:hypothetical protein WJX79_002460 [Trebouxia sp. C0005]
MEATPVAEDVAQSSAVAQPDSMMAEASIDAPITAADNAPLASGATLETAATESAPEASQEAAIGAPLASAEDSSALANGDAAPSANGHASLDEPDFMKEPPHGAEVFVGGVPRGATEEQIKEYASKVGPVHSCSLVKEPGSSGQNRGYGFVKFMTKEGANKAMQELHQTEMPAFSNMKLRFQPSQSKNKLYLGNIPKDMMKDRIHAKLDEHVKGVVDVEVVMSKDAPGTGRGFCFVEFYNHSAAAHAKGVLGSDTFRLGDRTLTVSYAEPKQSEMNQDQVKSVYVGGLIAGASEKELKEVFEALNMGSVEKVVIPGKKPDKEFPDYGFVHFNDRSSAVKLVEECERSESPRQLEYPTGNNLQIKMARPQVNAQQQPGAQFGRAPVGGRGAYAPRGGRGGRGGYDQYGYNQGQFGSGYGGGGYGYDAAGGYGYGDYSGYAGAQYGAGMQMVPMMLPSGQVGYVMQPGAPAGGSAYGADRAYSSGGRGRGGGGGYNGGGQRYRPY